MKTKIHPPDFFTLKVFLKYFLKTLAKSDFQSGY